MGKAGGHDRQQLTLCQPTQKSIGIGSELFDYFEYNPTYDNISHNHKRYRSCPLRRRGKADKINT